MGLKFSIILKILFSMLIGIVLVYMGIEISESIIILLFIFLSFLLLFIGIWFLIHPYKFKKPPEVKKKYNKIFYSLKISIIIFTLAIFCLCIYELYLLIFLDFLDYVNLSLIFLCSTGIFCIFSIYKNYKKTFSNIKS